MLRRMMFSALMSLISMTATAQVNPCDFGARGDGKTDDTAAIQKALDAAVTSGSLVMLPQGQYRLDGTLLVPAGVTLEGVWRGPHTSQLDRGTTLLAYAGRDDEDSSPLLTLATASTLKGVTIFYPEQTVENPRPYPWTIQGAAPTNQHANVIDVTIVNTWNGIDFGTHHTEGHHLRNVHMCALNKGVLIDKTTDIGRIENVHIHNVYWWRVSQPYKLNDEQVKTLEAFTSKNLVGFTIGRCDWEFISNCFVIWAKIGFHFVETSTGSANALVTQSGSDIGPIAVKIDRVQDHAGVAFENCQLMSGLEIGPDNKGPVKLTNCGFWWVNETDSQMILNGKGTVTLTATHFDDWDRRDKKAPCIQALNGSLIMQGCDFNGREPDLVDLYLGPELKSAVIIGNRFRRGLTMTNESKAAPAQIQMLGNVTE